MSNKPKQEDDQELSYKKVFFGLGTVLTLLVLLLGDPSSGLIQNIPFGVKTIELLISLALSVLYIGMLYVGVKAILDFVDLEALYKKAMLSSEASGYAMIAAGLMSIAVAIVILAASK